MMKGYKKIFWGMFLSIFHVNLGYIRILPQFIAYLVVVIATLLIWHICFLFHILRLGKMNLYEIKI